MSGTLGAWGQFKHDISVKLMWQKLDRLLWKGIEIQVLDFLISTPVVLFQPGWLYFELFLQLNFQLMLKINK